MRNSKNKLTTAVVFFPLLLFSLPELANAADNPVVAWIKSEVAGVVTGVAANAIGWTVYAINSIIAAIVGILIAFVSYVVEVFLYLNTHVTQSLAVQSGFKIAVSIANLGFVAAIIVIAIATILRSQTYGIKKILWKLVVAALLVNFSLVIAGVIINFADGLALYFINAVNPASNNFSNYTGFVSSLTGAFAPQRAFIFNASGTVDFANPAVQELKGAAAAGQTLASVFTPLFNLFFVSMFLFLILVTLIALVVMLIIRYVYVSFLLILMPFAWLSWIFPNFQSNWHKWWQEFLRWTFFAPIVMFFLFLAIQTAGAMRDSTAGNPLAAFQGTGFNSTANSPIIAGIQNFFGGFANQIISTVLQMIVVLALALGGLFISNTLGIKFANAAYTAGAAITAGLMVKGGGAAARFATHGPKPPPTKGPFLGVRQALHKVGSPIRGAAQKATQEMPGREAIYEFGKKAKEAPVLKGMLKAASAAGGKNLFNTVIVKGMKTGSGLFVKKEKEDIEKKVRDLASTLGIPVRGEEDEGEGEKEKPKETPKV